MACIKFDKFVVDLLKGKYELNEENLEEDIFEFEFTNVLSLGYSNGAERIA